MLSAKAKVRLKNALTRKSLADEMETAMTADSPLSAKLKRALIVALASSTAGNDAAAAVDASTGSMTEKTKARIRLAMASKKYGDELIAEIQG